MKKKQELLIINGGYFGDHRPEKKAIETLEQIEPMLPRNFDDTDPTRKDTVILKRSYVDENGIELMLPRDLEGKEIELKTPKSDEPYKRTIADVVPMLPTGVCNDCDD